MLSNALFAPLQGTGDSVTGFRVAGIPLIGDYNYNGESDAGDLDLQAVQMNTQTPDLAFDRNGDNAVDFQDRRVWVNDLKNTWLGDANLELEFNSSDMVQVFAAGKYETGEEAGWSGGDWDGSGFFDSSDMVTAFAGGGYEQGRRTAMAVVPEPASAIVFLGSLIVIAIRRRRLDP
jgi:hypothetical protein